MNKYEVIGYVGNDPEVVVTPGGMTICRLNVATKEAVKVNGEMVEETEWHSVRILGRAGEQAGNHVRKGCMVYVAGKKKREKWVSEGIEKHETRLVTWNFIEILKWPADSQSTQPQQRSQAQQSAPQAQRPAPQQPARQQAQQPAPQAQRPAPQQPAPPVEHDNNFGYEAPTDAFPDDFNFADLDSDAPF